jgi:hypothetical protein
MIQCPCCERALYVTHRDRYEDLSEHVSNTTPSMKDGYNCLNEDCPANALNVSWIADGDFYTDPPEGIKRFVAEKILTGLAKDGLLTALNSWQRNYDLGKLTIKRWTRKVRIGKWKFVFIPNEKGWKYPEGERYQPSPWKWKMEVWVGNEEMGYTHVVPLSRMVNYEIKTFNKRYRDWRESGSATSYQECVRILQRKNDWDSVDNRLFVRVASRIIRIIHPLKCWVLTAHHREAVSSSQK